MVRLDPVHGVPIVMMGVHAKVYVSRSKDLT